MDTLSSFETLVLTRAKRSNIPEDGILRIRNRLQRLQRQVCPLQYPPTEVWNPKHLTPFLSAKGMERNDAQTYQVRPPSTGPTLFPTCHFNKISVLPLVLYSYTYSLLRITSVPLLPFSLLPSAKILLY
jgi:hypothetical protein